MAIAIPPVLPHQLLLVSLAVILVVLVVARFVFKRRHVDYFGIFIVGIIWTLAGIIIGNFPLCGLGLVLMFSGIVHKNHWKRDPLDWELLKKREKRRRILTIVFGIIVLLALLFALIVLKWKL